MRTRIFLRILLMIPVVQTGLIIKAQPVTIGAKTGLIHSRFVGNGQSSSRNAFYFGGVANRELGSIYSIQVEINYASKGSNSEGVTTRALFYIRSVASSFRQGLLWII